MFKIICKNCCGVDVHKTWLYACIGITDVNSRTEYVEARFSTFPKGLKEFSAWLAKYSCEDGTYSVARDGIARRGSPSKAKRMACKTVTPCFFAVLKNELILANALAPRGVLKHPLTFSFVFM